MYIRDLQGNEYLLEGVIEHEYEINGDERIDMEIEYTPNNAEFLKKKEDLLMWIVIHDHKEYKIITSNQTGYGDKHKITITGILYMLDWLNTHRIDSRIDGYLSAEKAFDIVFEDSPFKYVLLVPTDKFQFQGIGEGASRLEIMKSLLERFSLEMKLVDRVCYLTDMVGNDTNFQYRYKINANNISKEVDGSEFFTYIRGYGDYRDESSEEELDESEDGEIESVEEEKDVTKIANLKRDYTSPLANIVGIREAPPVKDGRITKKTKMDAKLKNIVDNSLKISFNADVLDMSRQGYDYQHAVIGDRVFLTDERINLDRKIRVIKIHKKINHLGELLDIEITFGSLNLADNYSASFNNIVSSITEVIEDKRRLPDSSMSIISQSMVKKVQNVTTELTFDNNGIHAVDKQNANNIVTYNSAGLYISEDGGRSAKAALTAEGLVADAITTGTLNANLISITGGTKDRYIEMTSDFLALYGTYTRTWQGKTSTNNVYTRMKDGHLRFRNNDLNRSVYISDFGISTYLDGNESDASGTLEFFDYTYSGWRGVTLNSGMGVVALKTDANRIILDSNQTVNIESEEASVYVRPMKNNRNGNNEFRFWVKDNKAADNTDGILTYGSITSGSAFGSGIRFDKNKSTNFVYATNNNGDIGTGDFYARDLYGMLRAKDTNAYVGVDGALRVTDTKGPNGGSPNYKDIQAKDIMANSIRTDGGNFYIGCSTDEVRVTNNLLYNGGDIGYKPIKASDFKNASLEEYKENIEKWDFDALNQIANETDLYSFNYKSDENKETKHGLIIGEGYKTPKELISGDSVNLYAMITWAFRAIQQLNKKIEVLENEK
ncbi:phage tail protein [Staphylococcus haemolyticus]|uniref:phage tail protein n=1 Tax=Staphylococcus haemolyticus TaxID=1283 RepID=UPI00069CFB84|nr:phage tail protein [Staphylococcus haemolyticus]